MKRLAVVVFGAVYCACLVACGGSNNVDLTGIYQVNTDVGSSPCGADQPVPMAPAYLHFTQMDVFGQKYYAYDGCMDAAATMCDGSGGLFTGFTEPITNGWKGELTASSGGGGTCALTYAVRTAVFTKPQIAIEINEYSDTVMIPDAQCTTDEAKKRGTTMPCQMHEHIDATKQ